LAQVGEGVRIDGENLFVTCIPATSCERLLSDLKYAGLTLGSYPISSASSTIGDWIMNRGPSVGSFAYGGPEEQVRSLSVTLGNGKPIDTGYDKVTSFSTGYDLNRLFVGSYGSLGKLNSITLELIPAWEAIRPITYSFPDPVQLMYALKKILKGGTTPYHISFSIAPLEAGGPHVNILDVLYAGHNETVEAQEELLGTEMEGLNGNKEDTSVALDRWKKRFIASKVSSIGNFVLEQGFVPLKNFEDFRAEVHEISAGMAFDCVLMDRGFVAVAVSFPKAEEGAVNIEEKKTKVSYAIRTQEGYQSGFKAWMEGHEEKENAESTAKTMASVKTAVESGGSVPSPEMDGIVSKYNLQNEVPKWKSQMSRPKLLKMLPPRRGELNEKIRKDLESIVGDKNVAFDDWRKYYYTHDLAPLPKLVELAFEMIPDAVVRPQTEIHVREILKLAREHNMPIIGRGGGSWGFGGAISTHRGIMLDLSAMNKVGFIDEDMYLAYCEPAVTWENLATEVERKGFMVGASPSSAPVATVGGWTNTGGAGIGSYKHGTAYSQVKYIRAVLSDGRVINTMADGTSNRGSGYDLNALFSGSEGTLGIVTKIAVRLHPKAEEVRPLAYSFDKVSSLQEPLTRIAHSNTTPYNIAFYDENNFEFLRLLGKDSPEVGAMLSIALRGSSSVNDVDEKTLDGIMQETGGNKESPEVAEHEWEERSYEMRIRRLGPGGTIGEGVVPVTNFAEMMERAARISKEMKVKSTLRGNVVSRNSVAFMPFYVSNERFGIESLASMGFVKRIIDEAVKLDGRASGVGVWFAWNLDNLRGKDGAKVIRNLKALIDIDNIMNPGKMTEMRMRWGIPIPGFLMNAGLNVLGMAKKVFPKGEMTGVTGG
jgi:glycolate oxidase